MRKLRTALTSVALVLPLMAACAGCDEGVLIDQKTRKFQPPDPRHVTIEPISPGFYRDDLNGLEKLAPAEVLHVAAAAWRAAGAVRMAQAHSDQRLQGIEEITLSDTAARVHASTPDGSYEVLAFPDRVYLRMTGDIDPEQIMLAPSLEEPFRMEEGRWYGSSWAVPLASDPTDGEPAPVIDLSPKKGFLEPFAVTMEEVGEGGGGIIDTGRELLNGIPTVRVDTDKGSFWVSNVGLPMVVYYVRDDVRQLLLWHGEEYQQQRPDEDDVLPLSP